MTIGERLQKLRKDKQYTQEQLAEILGVSRQAISKWESDQGQPEINNVIKLSEIYNVTTDYILQGKNDYHEPISTEPISRISPIGKTAINIIVVMGATAGITICFITVLGLLGKFIL